MKALKTKQCGKLNKMLILFSSCIYSMNALANKQESHGNLEHDVTKEQHRLTS